MSLSLIAVNQREKEEEELRSFLTYSLLGSVAFHALVLFFGAMLWDRQPALADNAIEVIMVDPPPEETPPEPKVSPTPPAPSPSPVVTPTVPPPPPTQAQQPQEPPKPVEPPTPPPEPPQPVVTPPPIQPPRLASPPTPPPEPPQPVVTPTTPVVPEPEVTPQPESVAENQPSPQPEAAPSLPPTPKRDSKPREEPLKQPIPDQPVSEDTPAPPSEPVAANQPETPQRFSGNSRPLLPAPSEDNKPFRDEVAQETSRDSVESSDIPTLPQPVAVNRPTPPQRQTAQSQALPGDTASSFQTRPSLDNSESFPGASIGENEETVSTPTAPGTVAVNRGTPPQRRVAQSQALPGNNTGGSRQGRPSLDNSSDSPGGSIPGEDATTPSSVVPGTVAVNRGTPPRRPVAGSQALPGETGGTRQGRPGLDNSSGSSGGEIPGEDSAVPNSFVPGRVAVNRAVPPRPPSNPEPGTDDGGAGTDEVDGAGLSCLSSCQPEYPRRLAQRGVEGYPVIRFVLDPSGRPTNMEVAQSSGNRELDGAAIEAVRKMRFAPPGSRPLRVRMGITFTLGG